jgi:hypothetical protein
MGKTLKLEYMELCRAVESGTLEILNSLPQTHHNRSA